MFLDRSWPIRGGAADLYALINRDVHYWLKVMLSK